MPGLRILLVAVVCVWAISYAGADEGIAELSIGTGEGTLGEYVKIPVTLTTNGTKPGTIEFDITYDTEKLKLDASHIEAGPVLTAIGDPLWTTVWPDKAAFIIGGFNTTLSDGVLCYLNFRIVGLEPGTMPVEFVQAVAGSFNGEHEIPISIQDGYILADSRGPDCFAFDKDSTSDSTASVAAGFPMAAVLIALGLGNPARMFRRRKK
jgi:hypothetical protein